MRTQYLAEMPAVELRGMPRDPMVNVSWTEVAIDPGVKHCIGVGASHVFLSASHFVSDVKNREAADAWSRGLFEAVRNGAYDAAHPGLTREKTLEEQLGCKAARARELKARYDPNNVFRYAVPRFE
jgi:FAD/FMN-containing dehydrogenase